ncbi:MAG: hypothetical protein JSV33_05475 [bacterium]|nr:MAG: hypothetical protein JSV33_05475 [bacterium]
MSIFMGFGVGIIFVFIFAVVIGAFFMWIAAKIARVERSSFGRAIVAAIGSSFVSLLVAFLFHWIPLLGNLIGFIVGLFLSILVIKAAFDTSFGKALLVWTFDIIAKIVSVIIGTILVASSFAFLSLL